MVSFGEKLLKKYGWNEGEGIGKDSQGIVKPIKASFKFDQTGVGYDIGEQFTLNWWEHQYNKSASKIDDPDNKDIKSDTKLKSNTFDNKSLYSSRFRQSSVLTNNTEKYTVIEPEVHIEEKPSKKNKTNQVSDEDLYKICGGRTAHKGARHGIKMSGKLARIMEQEKEEADKLKIDVQKRKHTSTEATEFGVSEHTETFKKKKKKKSKNTSDCDE